MAEYSEVLLKQEEKIYYDENCPGCKIDKLKYSNPGIPFKLLFFVFVIGLVAALPISSLFPFLYFMIKDFHIAKREEDIGYYVGFVGSAFMFGRALTSILWGMIADRYGRKPVIIFGILTVVIFNTLFGLSTNFWMAVSTRFLLGSLCGILGPMRAYASEICRKEYQALGMSITSTAWGIGLVIGPALGGFFSQPAEKFPKFFSKESLFGRFPYFLPCLLISVFAVVATVLCFWMPETLHFHSKNDEEHENFCNSSEPSSFASDLKTNLEESERKCPTPQQSLLKNWPLMSSVIVYCVFQLHDMAYSEIFPLWAVSPKTYGGLSYSTTDVGLVLSISGFGMLLFQLFFYSRMERTFGPVVFSRIGAVITIALLSSYPFIAKLSGLTLTLLIDSASVLKNAISVSIATCLFLLQNRAVNQSQRGAANGISMSAMSLFKAIGPAGGGAIFSWAQNHQKAAFLPGFGMLLFQLFFYSRMERTFGPVVFSRIGAVITIALLSSYPFIAKLSGLTLTLLIDSASVLKNAISVSIATCLFLLQNRAVSQSQRGAANGISMSAMSLFKAIGPAGGGAIFSWAQNHQKAAFLPGDHMVFFILNVVEFIALIMTFKPFLALPEGNIL